MNEYTLKTNQNDKILFSGQFHTFKQCLETAVNNNIDLSMIDLKYKNLSNANLDGAHMPGANFKGANLIGANLSECHLQNANFNNTVLYNCCFAYSQMNNCEFLGAAFGATIIEGTNIQDCIFSTLSCFELDFNLSRAMTGCQYVASDYKCHNMSQPPIMIKGLLNSPIIILDQKIRIGSRFFLYEDALPAIQALFQKTIAQSYCKTYQQKISG